jgi:hypothetical protein
MSDGSRIRRGFQIQPGEWRVHVDEIKYTLPSKGVDATDVADAWIRFSNCDARSGSFPNTEFRT